jgi:hypothetical protein
MSKILKFDKTKATKRKNKTELKLEDLIPADGKPHMITPLVRKLLNEELEKNKR